MSGIVNSLNAAGIAVNTAMVPGEGPRILVLDTMDFSLNASYDFDGSTVTDQNRISMFQTLWIDTTGAAQPVIVTINGYQKLQVKANTNGWYAIFAPNPTRINFACSDATFKLVSAILANVPVAPFQYSTV